MCFIHWLQIWNTSWICVSSLRRGLANLLCIIPILVYVLWSKHPREFYVWRFTGGNSCGKVKQFKLPQAVQGPLRRRWTFSHTFFKPCATCILPKNWPFFRSRTNDHTAPCLTMEMLFLGYVLMIIIVTNLAWEPVSQDLYPWLHSNSISTPEMLPRKCSPRLILCQSYLRMCALGKDLVEFLQILRHSYLFSVTSWEVYYLN